MSLFQDASTRHLNQSSTELHLPRVWFKMVPLNICIKAPEQSFVCWHQAWRWTDTWHEDEQRDTRHEDEQTPGMKMNTDTRHEDEQIQGMKMNRQTPGRSWTDRNADDSMQFSRRQSKENTRKCEERLKKESGEIERQECMCKNTKFTTLAVFRGALLPVSV